MDSRPATPEAPPQDLWSSILDSVSSSRSIPSKQIVLLGQPSTGKTIIASALLQKAASDEGNSDRKADFALGYDYADVRDEADEDTLARLSVYTVPSSDPSYTALLPHFIPAVGSLPHTCFVIVLDWTRPWTFVDELETWLKWIETWAKGDGSREAQIAKEEGRERLQSHLQHYTEPTTDPLPTSTSIQNSTLLELAPGVFTHNLAGVPIIVACAKADLIDEGHDPVAGASGMGGMVKGKSTEWEERTDGVMQVLRTICLKYGAGLFYTTPLTETLQVLRQYALHLLFVPPAPTPGQAAGTEATAPIRNPFPFNHKPNTLDRDRIVIPAGWDSWNKVTVMRESFEAKVWGEAWDQDLNADGEDSAGGAKSMYASLVPDQGTKPPPLPPFNSPTPEQAFLSKNYDENSKKADRDPRGAFRNPADLEGAAAGVVGPLSSSSFALPTVERALSEMDVSSVPMTGATATAAPTDARRRHATPSTRNPTTSPPHKGTSNPMASPPPGQNGQSQHEVLQNFFQSLLSNKDRPNSAASRKVNGTAPSVTSSPQAAKSPNADEGST